ncbi:MAG TPA: hypothetical protein VF574_12215 [Allosphingosinicella sp.]|jgi:predicted GNAT family acetyltransferase
MAPRRARDLIASGEVYAGFRNGELVAAAVVRGQSEIWTSIGVVATAPAGHDSRLGVRFTNALMYKLIEEGRSICAGVGESNPFAFRAALALGLAPARQSWTAMLADP